MGTLTSGEVTPYTFNVKREEKNHFAVNSIKLVTYCTLNSNLVLTKIVKQLPEMRL